MFFAQDGCERTFKLDKVHQSNTFCRFTSHNNFIITWEGYFPNDTELEKRFYRNKKRDIKKHLMVVHKLSDDNIGNALPLLKNAKKK